MSRSILARSWAVAFFLCLVLVANCEALPQQRFDFLETALETYSNVLVTDITPDRVFIRHANGITAVKVNDLQPEIRKQLGLSLVEVKPSAARTNTQPTATKSQPLATRPIVENATEHSLAGSDSNEVSRVESIHKTWQQFRAGFIAGMFEPSASAERRHPRSMRAVAWQGIITVAIYLGHCFALLRLCQRANGEGSLLVFLPGLRWIPLFRAAGMSLQLLLVWLTFAVSIICPPPMSAPAAFAVYLVFVAVMFAASIALYGVWCFRICTELNRSAWLGLLVLFPLTYLFTIIYLARSGRIEKPEAAPRHAPQIA